MTLCQGYTGPHVVAGPVGARPLTAPGCEVHEHLQPWADGPSATISTAIQPPYSLLKMGHPLQSHAAPGEV